MAKATADLRSLARAQTDTCVRVLTGVMRAPKAPHSARVAAASELLNRGWGKAPATLTGADGGDIRIVIRQIIENIDENDAKVIEHDPDEGKDDDQG